jgi:hypothetical protein
LLEFLVAIVHQSAPLGDGVVITFEKDESSERKVVFSFSKDLIKTDEPFSNVLSEMLADPSKLYRYVDLNFGNFVSPFVDILNRNRDDYVSPSDPGQVPILLSWVKKLKNENGIVTQKLPWTNIFLDKRKLTLHTWSRV